MGTASAGTIAAGDSLLFLGHESDRTGFIKVQTSSGKQGWVSGGYLRQLNTGPQMLAGGCTYCGYERWAVKTASDADAGNIGSTVTTLSIGSARGFPAPAHKPQASRVGQVERSRYSITAYLRGWVLENDQDIHLVLSSAKTGAGKTIIAEIPAQGCQGVCSSDVEGEMKTARSTLTNELGDPPGQFTPINPARRVTLTGVGFFDFLHGQHGVAPNGFELHPVLGVQFN